MKATSLSLISSFLYLSFTAASLQAEVIWEAEYSPNHLPNNALSAPQWTRLFNTGSASLSGGSLIIETLNATDNEAYRLNGHPAFAPGEDGLTLEFSIKGTSGNRHFQIRMK